LIIASVWSARLSLTGSSPFPGPAVTQEPEVKEQAETAMERGGQQAAGPNTATPVAAASPASGESSRETVTKTAQGDQQPQLASTETPAKDGRALESRDVESVTAAKPSVLAAHPADAAPVPGVPEGSSALAEKSNGIFLRYSADKREWERLHDSTPLNRSDQLLSLAPFRANIVAAKMRIMLVGETEVRVLSQPTDSVPALDLARGQLLLRGPSTGALKVAYSERTVKLEISPDSVIALERVPQRSYGQPVTQAPPLTIYCIQGEPTLTLGQKQEALKAPSVTTVDIAGSLKRVVPESLPGWATETEPSSYDQQVRDQFLRVFHANRPVLADIVSAIDDERPEIKRLSISALKALGDLTYLMPILSSRENDPVARRATIEGLRSYMGLGPDAAGRVREQLNEEFSERTGALVERMLVGYSPQEAANREIYPRLVGLLAPEQESVGIRELALDTLKRLTGRDDLGYDPDKPGGKGLEAWKDLLQRGQLHPISASPKAK
jgi:hypothetical protein